MTPVTVVTTSVVSPVPVAISVIAPCVSSIMVSVFTSSVVCASSVVNWSSLLAATILRASA
eukprot:CAMPEP_0204329394 /NCGR_PEP_ID=MMETSP0469-20131031/14116_1 /ASSEMBLY_ACC=CAM_ASM_000384 /TAXON_ID=2969 /ORGANISM="Oxyrrhis marina" /LENGTH=60 /DNA_ID=CAMNT_0051311977 /DNA_START=34 /DNA_END=213 /DNA_ORIENTATION=+